MTLEQELTAVRNGQETAVANNEVDDMQTEELSVVRSAVATIESREPCAGGIVPCGAGVSPAAAQPDPGAPGHRHGLPESDAMRLDRQPQAWERQADSRRAEREVRKRSVAFSRWSQRHGQTLSAAAAALDVSPRTLRRWRLSWHSDRLALRPRGRPCRCAAPEIRNDVVAFLDEAGPATGLPTLQNHYPQVTRAELIELLTTYRGDYRQAHARQQSVLHWQCPGSVWAMDFSHPLGAIDGCFPAIFTVRDLASHQQLLWLPVADETADTVICGLHELFDEHGAPLVLKCDNGPGFVAAGLKQFLRDWSVVTLYSPPYAPWYNGAVERANRSLKDITEHVAEHAGHAAYWTSADLHTARLRLNRWNRPWGADGPTPEETWDSRSPLTMDERDVLFEKLDLARRVLCREREVDPDMPLDHRQESELLRLALQPVMESGGYLYVTRRRIAPVLTRRKCDKIM
ncbi:MAG: transposase [Planctomycetia bacterium]|nr:transposase [Planctomycetia bacterium]